MIKKKEHKAHKLDKAHKEHKVHQEHQEHKEHKARQLQKSHKKHIAVLQGGLSSEREVSLVSGKACASALRERGYQVSLIDADHQVAKTLQAVKPDIVFNALHGTYGEDGAIQGLLEWLNIPYTHSGVLASALAMNKVLAKTIFKAHHIPVADHIIIKTKQNKHPTTPPYVVKPISEGSSMGVVIVREGNLLPDCLSQDSPFLEKGLMVEAYIEGRELTCGVIHHQPSEVLELCPRQGFYNYKAKYEEGETEYKLPAIIPHHITTKIQSFALKAHHLLGCKGITRSDFRFNEEKEQLVMLEINTQPGMTPLSLVPKLAKHQGISFQDLVVGLIKEAICQQ